MLSYCLKYRKNTKKKNPEIVKTKNNGLSQRIMLLSRSTACNSKNSKFI